MINEYAEVSMATEVLFHRLNGHRSIAYVPARGIAFTLNESGLRLLLRLQQGMDAEPLDGAGRSIAARLQSLGILSAGPGDGRRPLTASAEFTRLVLLLTRDCNLRCRYCFSDGGQIDTQMPYPVATAAVDFMVAHRESRGRRSLVVSFHGGGEPTVAWDLLVACFAYAHERCSMSGIRCRTHLTSNCVWSSAQADWVAGNIDSLTVSLDGTREVSDLHRPLAEGGSSHSSVLRTLDVLRGQKCQVSVRATVSEFSVGRLPELVEYFHSLGAQRVQFEPLTRVGRASQGKLARPSPEIFCRKFWIARDLGKQLGCNVFCSYFRPERLVTAFCGADGRALNVTPEGLLTTCHRVTLNQDAGSATLVVGRYDSSAGTFLLENSRLENLRLQANALHPRCVGCVAKYHCAGGCYAQNAVEARGDTFAPDSYRCMITKKLFGEFLAKAVIAGGKTAEGEHAHDR
jgi:uncharacterized protein